MFHKEREKEYFVVPGLELLSVSEDGEVVYSESKEILEQRMSGDYKCVNVLGESWHVHRMMALALLPKPDLPVEELDVNHKDTNKLNNVKDNLEWATRSQNCVHALENGLWTTAIPVLVKDLRTDEVTEYYGLNECAREFNVNPALIHIYLKDSSKIRKFFYVFIRKGQEWPNLTKDDILTQTKGTQKVIVGLHLETNTVCSFSTIGKAAEVIAVKPDTLRTHIERYGDKPYHGFSFRYANSYDEILEGLLSRDKNTFRPSCRRKPVPIIVKDTETGTITEWTSTEEFAKSVGAKWNTVRTAISRNNGKWNKYEISYKTQMSD